MLSPALLVSIFIFGFAVAGGLGSLCYAWARRRWQTMALFAGLSFALAAYALSIFFQQSAPTPAMALLPIRLIEVFACTFLLLLPFLYRSLCGQRPGWPEYLIIAFYTAAIVLALARPAGYEWDRVTQMVSLEQNGIHHLYYPQGKSSAIILPIRIGHLLVTLYCLSIAWRGWRAGHNGFWAVMVLPVSLFSVILFALGDAVGLWHFTFDVGGWSASALYFGLGSCILRAERALFAERDTLFASLSDREEKLSALMSAGLELAGLLDPEGRIVFVNRAALELVGVEAKQVQGVHFAETPWWSHSPALQQQVRNAVTAAASGSTVQFEATHIESDGHEITVDFSLAPYFGSDGKVHYLVAEGRDVTAHKLAEEALQKSEHRLALAISATNDAIWERNIETGEAYFSPRWYEMLGYQDRAFAMNFEVWQQLCHPADLPPALDQIRQTLSLPQGEGYEVEFRMKSATGDWVWILGRGNVVERDAEGKPILLSGTNTDITARKQADNRWRRLMDSNMVGVFHWQAEGAILDANDALLKMLGYTQDDLRTGRLDWRTITPPEYAEADRHAIEEVMTVEVCTPYEKEYLHRDGSRVPILITAAMLEGDRSEGVAFVLDMTELQTARRQTQQSLQRLRFLTRHLQSLQEKERAHIAREVHDELGQALTGLKMYAISLKRHLSRPDKALSPEAACERLDSMTRLIDTTIGSVRRIATELRPAVLDTLGLIPALEWQAQEFQNRTGISCEFVTLLKKLSLDREADTAIFRIFQESLTNIARHSGAQRVVTHLEEDADGLLLEIHDDGVGMEVGRSTGTASFGLLGMQERALLLGGELAFTAPPGEGTTVTLRIPLPPEAGG